MRRPAAHTDTAESALAPPGSDWVWRPGAFHAPRPIVQTARVVPGHGLGDGLAVFHDCPALDIRLSLLPPDGQPDAPPHGFAIEVGQFTGSYLSLVADLPAAAARGLSRRNIVSVRANLQVTGPTDVFVRLNLRHGPNTETLVRQTTAGIQDTRTDFDLATVAFRADQVESAWVDLIVSRPAGIRLALRDLVVSHRLRAEL